MTRGAATTAFLRELARHGFVPPETDVPPELPGTAAAARSAALVAVFAAEFWSLPADERVARWGDLKATAVGPAAVRLAELRAGTCVEPVPQADAGAAELAALVKELVTLPPRARAARRFDWLTARAADVRRWRAASRTVLRTDLSLAALEPRLFEWLAVGAVPARVAGRPDRGGDGVGIGRLGRRRLAFWSFLFGVAVFLVLVANGTIGPGRAARQRPPAYPGEQGFTADEVRRFDQYERTGRTGASPDRWLDWVAAGRPRGASTP